MMENHDKPIMVSVWCRTYNHVNYIKDALDGLVSQQTDFIYKVIVFDDASTDGTSDIVRAYAEKYPEIIYAIIAEENIYHHPNTKKIIADIWKKHLTGKYMAFCEGDDFWIDCSKLKIQVDYMESHPDCAMYMHNSLWLNCRNGAIKAGNPYKGKCEWDVAAEELIMQYNGYPSTASFLFKREQIDKPQFFGEVHANDYTTILYAFATGSVHYSSRIMSVYRVFADNSYAVRMQQDGDLRICFYLKMLFFFWKYDAYTNYKYHKWIAKRIACYELTVMYGSEPNIPIAESVRKSMEQGNIFPEESYKYVDRLEKQRRQELPEELKTFIDGHKHIIIMGTGEFGVYAARMLISHEVEFDGFAVSAKKDEESSFMGKTVYNLSEIPYDEKDTGVVIGICPFSGKWSWDSVLHSLAEAGVKNWYCPFL